MNKDIKLGYKIKKWHSKLNDIAAQVELHSLGLCLELEKITDEIDDYINERDCDRYE